MSLVRGIKNHLLLVVLIGLSPLACSKHTSDPVLSQIETTQRKLWNQSNRLTEIHNSRVALWNARIAQQSSGQRKYDRDIDIQIANTLSEADEMVRGVNGFLELGDAHSRVQLALDNISYLWGCLLKCDECSTFVSRGITANCREIQSASQGISLTLAGPNMQSYLGEGLSLKSMIDESLMQLEVLLQKRITVGST